MINLHRFVSERTLKDSLHSISDIKKIALDECSQMSSFVVS